MASAKLEILISAKDSASQVMTGVRAAFERRAMEIRSIGDGLVKHGEKVEKFLHGVSLLKIATETDGFKNTLSEISPELQKFTSNMLNAGLAIGGTLSLMKDMAHLSKLGAGLGVASFIGTVAAGTTVLGQGYLEADKARRDAIANGEHMAFNLGENARSARTKESFDLAMKQLTDAIEMGVPGALRVSNELAGQRDAIVAYNVAMDKGTAELKRQAEGLGIQNDAAKANAAALVKVREVLAERDRQTPAGQMRELSRVQAELSSAQGMNINPETQPQLWLEQQKQIEALTAELKTLNEGPIGKWRDALNSLGGRAAALLRPSDRGTGAVTTTSLGTLPGSAILGDSMSRLGLFSGGGRSNPLTGLAEQKLTSIDSAAKEQIRVLTKILQAVTNGQTYQFGQ